MHAYLGTRKRAAKQWTRLATLAFTHLAPETESAADAEDLPKKETSGLERKANS